jgi:hypothetical protein
VGPQEKSLAWVFRDLILDDEYGLTKLAKKPETVLDVGGNIGLFALWAGVNFPQATIHVYEPNPELLDSLENNAKQVGATVYSEGMGGGRTALGHSLRMERVWLVNARLLLRATSTWFRFVPLWSGWVDPLTF